MKLHHTALTTGLVTLALAAASSLSGQVTPTTAANAATGDLILGFWQPNSSATGYTSNLEVDLGAYSAYAGYASSGSLVHFSVTNIGTDLTATFGSWSSNPTLLWGAVRAGGGAGGSTPDAVISKLNANPAGGASTAYDPGFTTVYTGSAARLINNKAASLISSTGIKNAALAGSNTSVAILPTTNTNGWDIIGGLPGSGPTSTVFNAGANNPDFKLGNFGQSTNFNLVNGGSANGYEVSDLYFLKFNGAGNATVQYVGSLGLSADGTITYANQATYFSAVPEPSAYAAMVGALAIGLAVYRRRSVRLLAVNR